MSFTRFLDLPGELQDIVWLLTAGRRPSPSAHIAHLHQKRRCVLHGDNFPEYISHTQYSTHLTRNDSESETWHHYEYQVILAHLQGTCRRSRALALQLSRPIQPVEVVYIQGSRSLSDPIEELPVLRIDAATDLLTLAPGWQATMRYLSSDSQDDWLDMPAQVRYLAVPWAPYDSRTAGYEQQSVYVSSERLLRFYQNVCVPV